MTVHSQEGLLHDLEHGWRVRCSCGWKGKWVPSRWLAVRRWDVHHAQTVLEQTAAVR